MADNKSSGKPDGRNHGQSEHFSSQGEEGMRAESGNDRAEMAADERLDGQVNDLSDDHMEGLRAERGDQVQPGDELSAADGSAALDLAAILGNASELNKRLADKDEQMLRLQAEMQNVRRRSEADVDKARKFGLERFARELLPVVDSLEKAIEAASDDSASATGMHEGVELTLNLLLGALRKFDIESVDPAGEPFNPELHEAMSVVVNPDMKPNSVMAVLQKGYTISGRLLRPAMVIVSKAP